MHKMSLIYTSMKTLAELDRIYDSLKDQLSQVEKLQYCVNLIETTDRYLNGNARAMTAKMIASSRELIEAAQNEIMEAIKSNPKSAERLMQLQRKKPH
jgi:hypothetical protein